VKLTRGPIPLYYQIAQILRSQIRSQEYKPNDVLPTENEMIQSFMVSRVTVRQALQMLLSEGLIYRIAGKGTFVSPEGLVRQGEWSVRSIDEIIATGYATKLKFLEWKTIRAGEGVAKALRIPVGTKVRQFRGLRLVDDEPFFHATIHVPLDLAERIPEERLQEKPVIALLEESCGFRVREVYQWIAASLAGSEIAQHLELNPGDAVLLVERHFIDTTGRVVEVVNDHYRSDRRRLFLKLSLSGPDDVALGSRSEER
jgi:GntR family transcriptional regulator